MPRGGARIGAGRPRVESGPGDVAATLLDRLAEGVDAVDCPLPAGQETPLEYMVRVMNDPNVDDGRRDRLAVAAAPYLHPKVGESGKKEQKKAAAGEAGKGKFAPAEAPKLVVNNK